MSEVYILFVFGITIMPYVTMRFFCYLHDWSWGINQQ